MCVYWLNVGRRWRKSAITWPVGCRKHIRWRHHTSCRCRRWSWCRHLSNCARTRVVRRRHCRFVHATRPLSAPIASTKAVFDLPLPDSDSQRIRFPIRWNLLESGFSCRIGMTWRQRRNIVQYNKWDYEYCKRTVSRLCCIKSVQNNTENHTSKQQWRLVYDVTLLFVTVTGHSTCQVNVNPYLLIEYVQSNTTTAPLRTGP